MGSVKIHHLNLLTMCPFGGRLVRRGGPLLAPAEMVAHALLVETARDGLVLVDTGIGRGDLADPRARLGGFFLSVFRPRLGAACTAVEQITELGYRREDVRHIAVTHLDLDHAGGLPDFAEAEVHVHRRERDAALAPRTWNERVRYRRAHFEHGPRWVVHDVGGDRWHGFESVRVIADDVVLVPLIGHTRGHAGVAVRTPPGSDVEWLLHAGDAYFASAEMEDPPSCPPALRVFQSASAVDDRVRRRNATRLRTFKRQEGSRVRVFSAHCQREYRELAGRHTVS
jgi:glyoxylase-like metal-dependent hydrolase (beta-lactamase superfamily II)